MTLRTDPTPGSNTDPSFFDLTSGINNFITLGALVLVALVLAHLVRRTRFIPGVSGYLIAGALLGPYGLNFITAPMLGEISGLVDIALGLILYQLGAAFHFGDVLKTRGLLTASLIECSATFAFVFLAMRAFGIEMHHALVIAAIGISASPAILLHVAREVGAAGPVTDNARNLVALNNVISFAAFSLALPTMHRVNGATDWFAVMQPLYVAAGSLLLGFTASQVMIRLERWVSGEPEYRLALMIGVVAGTLGLARMLHLSALFGLLVLGIGVRAFDRTREPLHTVVLGPPVEILYIVMFFTAGASLNFGESPLALAAAPLFVLARTLAKGAGVYGTLRLFRHPSPQAEATAWLLLPMASLAIGLTRRTVNLFPDIAGPIPVVVLASIAILELIGPVVSVYAYRRCGEAGRVTPPP